MRLETATTHGWFSAPDLTTNRVFAPCAYLTFDPLDGFRYSLDGTVLDGSRGIEGRGTLIKIVPEKRDLPIVDLMPV